jgi:hypothetical protein
MIACSNFIWLHLPRTGGTATAAWMREIARHLSLAVAIDDDGEAAKHDNILLRSARKDGAAFKGLLAGSRPAVAMNFKRLPNWLESNYRFARSVGLEVSPERYLAGEFLSIRMGRYCPADWWLDYFAVENVTDFLRCDRLETDWPEFFARVTGIAPPHIPFQRMNAKGESIAFPPDWHKADWADAYRRNPRWSGMEARIYNSD